ncbi:FAD-dependent oxidoreductase [Corynebacterium hindlerae]|uniref:FAD-dependent oxidoreductase n=1 Tax=Corynebacterium hindlerae TaxID=699041 RepID=UPI001AD69803|nr:FAD-dependent oxidoreductase [Corynebacterium hindlerae]QTH60529.1 FAD-dependent oxidoreductase [Corynebacterium hindlerae]
MARTIIVGGVAGGMSTATRLRRNDEARDITVFERSGYVSFANCGLPYHLGGVIESRDALLLQTPESLGERFNIDVRVRHEVLSIDTTAQTVLVRDLATGTDSTETYDDLVLAPGAQPFTPPIPGIERAAGLRTVEDLDHIKKLVSGDVKTAVVIGGGFIGVEVAENLQHRGLAVTLIEAAPQIMAPFDPEISILLQRRLQAGGIDVRTNAIVTAISETAVTAGTEEFPADVVIAAIGVRPDAAFISDAGITTAKSGHILVDEHGRTNVPNIYALGDAVMKRDFLDGSDNPLPLAQNANRHGRVIADVITGRSVTTKPVYGTSIIGAFGFAVAGTGWNEKRLQAAGREYRAIHTHPVNHAGYYPGAKQMTIKLLVDPATDQILGAQAAGEQGVDKRIDVILTAMTGGLTASDLADLELAYAPQFGMAKDPVALIGMVNDNIVAGEKTIQWHELASSTLPLIDVRTPSEFESEPIPGAINIPVDDLRSRVEEVRALANGGPVIVHCRVGLRGHIAVRTLAGLGVEAINLDGGYLTWEAGVASQGNGEH